ncbi:ABC transporter ATP-binding protein [Conexibacter arvalis]|uniref:Oligopeptide/dipeptide ABC transporter ATP-binding protein n=1 Tax=Conexibacter arvalis TaxID=912552 RepID=A0A840IH11_9ACTN|nr:ABC transporter ATP-binding protein [Conexibacter arvalis]MBB4664069.1 oligopeptide/dipeptide ABC transporter ATP-binding protein [Conexibacter arvalis]
MTAALTVTGLTIEVVGRDAPLQLVRDVSFQLGAGERLGLVGESGSGKSLTALAVMRLLQAPVRISSGQITLSDGTDVAALEERELAAIRGRRAAMVYQDPLSALNPVRRVGDQIAEAIHAHEDVTAAVARRRVVELLREVGVPDPERRADQYPHEFSGGMRQRVVIAMALSAGPELLVADEPTTALDVTTQARILELLLRLAEQRGLAVILITHDLGVAARFCDRLQVMYAGRLVETGPLADLYRNPLHPYSEGLLASVCRLDADPAAPMPALAGQPPSAGQLPAGCSFRPRCAYAYERCERERPPLTEIAGGRAAACHLAPERSAGTVAPALAPTGGDR